MEFENKVVLVTGGGGGVGKAAARRFPWIIHEGARSEGACSCIRSRCSKADQRRKAPAQDFAAPSMRFETPAPLALEAAFDGGRLTSDGGLLWLAEVDRELGICGEISARVAEWRGRGVKHPLSTLVRQRVYQIASGYQDQNDANALRSEPLLKPVSGRLPEAGEDLARPPSPGCKTRRARGTAYGSLGR